MWFWINAQNQLKVTSMQNLNRITFNPNVMGGKLCIRGMRVTVGMIVGMVAAGRETKDILEAYPYLETEDIRQSQVFVAQNQNTPNKFGG